MIEYMQSTHHIDDMQMTIGKVTSTKVGESQITRTITFTTAAESAQVDFTEDGFELFRAILRQY